ncbi:MoaD/ThiS family protein [Nocardioides massiliensis]|uniref:Molybdopterin synthase sulfur carrier subunit n=1 Tax=Nocardioides massiliensis TaxID=1325935 RepID=A0ABT9NNV3_9ACTN|nr:MoaD/ThiS family protein [Nocardioides massiliensis]MDP9821745.1 molybdopterin converting factor small subunit [Nocardioides massiliensis]
MTEASTDVAAEQTTPAGTVTVRYWAAARSAAGRESDRVELGPEGTLAEVLATVSRVHADSPKFADVLGCCSILVGDRPVAGLEPSDVRVRPGDSVELLPPFAGG